MWWDLAWVYSNPVQCHRVGFVGPWCPWVSIGPWSWPSGLFPFGAPPPSVLGPGPPAPWPLGCPSLRAGAVLVVFLQTTYLAT